MLVGVAGEKQSCTRVACHLAAMDCFTIEIRRGYGGNEFSGRPNYENQLLRTQPCKRVTITVHMHNHAVYVGKALLYVL
jgi:hypothetical protein